MRIAFLVTVDVPETGEFDVCAAAQREMAERLQERLQRGSKGEWTVQPHSLTPAEVAALP